MTSKPILCVDFDGVLHSYVSPWKDAVTIEDGPVPGAMEWLEACTEVFDVHIFSSRSHQRGGIEAMKRWLTAHACAELGAERGMKLFYRVLWPTDKPTAFLTIDDRAQTFTGQFEPPDKLLEFVPWNRK